MRYTPDQLDITIASSWVDSSSLPFDHYMIGTVRCNQLFDREDDAMPSDPGHELRERVTEKLDHDLGLYEFQDYVFGKNHALSDRYLDQTAIEVPISLQFRGSEPYAIFKLRYK